MFQIESFAKQQIQVDNLSKTRSLIRLQADSTITSDGCRKSLESISESEMILN